MVNGHRIDADLILFDLDDTLCDSHLAQQLRLRHAFGLAATEAGVADSIDLDAMIEQAVTLAALGADFFPEVFADNGLGDERSITLAREWIESNRLHGLDYFDDAIETIDAVRSAQPDRRIGVITNGPAWIQRPKVELLGVANHVDFVIISGEFGVHKPDPAIFHEALRLGSADAAATVFIGDSIENDVAGAHASGMTSIWINRFDLPWPEDAQPPHFTATGLADVRGWLG